MRTSVGVALEYPDVYRDADLSNEINSTSRSGSRFYTGRVDEMATSTTRRQFVGRSAPGRVGVVGTSAFRWPDALTYQRRGISLSANVDRGRSTPVMLRGQLADAGRDLSGMHSRKV